MHCSLVTGGMAGAPARACAQLLCSEQPSAALPLSCFAALEPVRTNCADKAALTASCYAGSCLLMCAFACHAAAVHISWAVVLSSDNVCPQTTQRGARCNLGPVLPKSTLHIRVELSLRGLVHRGFTSGLYGLGRAERLLTL